MVVELVVVIVRVYVLVERGCPRRGQSLSADLFNIIRWESLVLVLIEKKSQNKVVSYRIGGLGYGLSV
jgi:hypothetical protein